MTNVLLDVLFCFRAMRNRGVEIYMASRQDEMKEKASETNDDSRDEAGTAVENEK
jgi:hypothetical protein